MAGTSVDCLAPDLATLSCLPSAAPALGTIGAKPGKPSAFPVLLAATGTLDTVLAAAAGSSRCSNGTTSLI